MVGDNACADVLGLRLHLLHEPRALDHVGEAWVVLDVGSDRELAAGLDALNQDRLQHGTRRIDGGGVASRTRADDDDFRVGSLSHVLRPPDWASFGRLPPGRPETGRLFCPCPMYGLRASYARYATPTAHRRSGIGTTTKAR